MNVSTVYTICNSKGKSRNSKDGTKEVYRYGKVTNFEFKTKNKRKRADTAQAVGAACVTA